MTPEETKEFDEKFPPTQKEATHYINDKDHSDCKCWSCNGYRNDVISHISSLLEKRVEKVKELALEVLDEDFTKGNEDRGVALLYYGLFLSRLRRITNPPKE